MAYLKTGKPRGRPAKNLLNGLTPAQMEIEACDKRFIFVCAGRRFGKTSYAAERLKRSAISKPNQKVWYVAPTQKLAKELMWMPLRASIPKMNVERFDSVGLNIWLTNGSVIGIRGSDREDNLRGTKLDDVVLEEYSFHKRGVWDLIIRPQLADTRGGAMFIGTPSAKKGPHYRQLHDYAKSGVDPEWAYFHKTIYDNPYISREEIEAIKKSNSEKTWRQEYLAEFVEEEGSVYYEFLDSKNVYDAASEYKEARKLVCARGLDYGLQDATACAWVHVLENGHLIVTDEYSQNNRTIQASSRAIKDIDCRNPRSAGPAILDSTCWNRQGSSNSTIALEFCKEGVPVVPSKCTNKMNYGVSIDVMKKLLIGDGKQTYLHISSECRELIEGFKNWQYGGHEPDILCALRLAVWFIVKTGMTKITDAAPILASDAKTSEDANGKKISVPYIPRLSARTSASTQMSWMSPGAKWDFNSGGWN